MKKDIFEKYAIEFIKEQSDYFGEYAKKYAKEQLPLLENLKYDKLIEIAKDKDIYSFCYLEGSIFCNDISYLDNDGKSLIYCDVIDFISEGKVDLEEYCEIFTYLRNCIINSSQNPIRTATVVTIIG